MIKGFQKIRFYTLSASVCILFTACSTDPMLLGEDPFAPTVFKEGKTTMPLNPPNPDKLQSFYVSVNTVFKFAIDTSSIVIGADGVTRYIVVMTNPSGQQQAQYEGIRCDSYQWRLYGTFEQGAWKPNPLSEWKEIKLHTPNRYQAALAQGALCSFNSQETRLSAVLRSLNPEKFTGGTQPSNSYGVTGN
ncbi:hypothetical protein G6671_01050 [Polynucleobacter paneuropaeus]|uniref:CNP1-like uncharacterized domain-containing protein n=1 Tax=Polynucleobacter paneuropaeus TaxID=2527775 RepID=A0A9Q2ZW20_9BURK|nr:hypothetical protein [Polynucleobacter paneuropaeus]QWD37410.1 hypothetical protein G6671_01050 [Polynucleobacter paneuropaeus]